MSDTPRTILELFRRGYDTSQIARMELRSEAYVLKELTIQRNEDLGRKCLFLAKT